MLNCNGNLKQITLFVFLLAKPTIQTTLKLIQFEMRVKYLKIKNQNTKNTITRLVMISFAHYHQKQVKSGLQIKTQKIPFSLNCGGTLHLQKTRYASLRLVMISSAHHQKQVKSGWKSVFSTHSPLLHPISIYRALASWVSYLSTRNFKCHSANSILTKE